MNEGQSEHADPGGRLSFCHDIISYYYSLTDFHLVMILMLNGTILDASRSR